MYSLPGRECGTYSSKVSRLATDLQDSRSLERCVLGRRKPAGIIENERIEVTSTVCMEYYHTHGRRREAIREMTGYLSVDMGVSNPYSLRVEVLYINMEWRQ